MPKISVIMPVYNGEKYLREAVDSILNQTFTDFEFIIINDASKDSTEEIIKSYTDDRIIYLKNEQNLGVAGTLNRGLDAAKGEYIARMDADDISMPERFEKQVAFFESHPDVGLCGSNVTVFTETEEYTTEFPCSHKDVRLQLFFGSQLAHPTVMARRRLIDEGIYRYDTRWEGREDYELWMRVVQKTNICNLSQPLLRYREHNSQVTKKKDSKKLDSHTELKYKFLNEMGICVSMDEARIFSKYCIGIKEYTAYEFKVFTRIINDICNKYQASGKFIKNIKKSISVTKPQKSAYIITCHDVYNYGASLQAYALQTHLEKADIDTKIIDYQAPYLSKLFNFSDIPEKYKQNFILKWLFRCYLLKVYIPAIPKYFRYKKFNKTYLKLTQKKYTDNEKLKELEVADMYFCGSDQIWNSYNYPCGKDPAFYLDFAPLKSAKFSYAASFGSNKIDESYSDFINEKVSRLDSISVREKSGQEILENLGISGAELAIDPVFLLSKDEWSRLAREKEEKPYVLIYAFDNMDKAQEIAGQIADENGFEIKEFGYGKNEYASGPSEFLYLIQNARYVVTNSFHAIAFSLIFEKQFWVVSCGEKSLTERLDNILEITNLSGRKIDTVNDVIDRYKEKIDYSEKSMLIEAFADSSKQYIERCIEIERCKNC